MRSLPRKILTACLAFLVPLVCLADPGPSVDENRQTLEKWRQNPQRAERLKRNQAYFRRLAPDAQERLRKLERDLNEEGVAMRGRLKGVMHRYTAWLDTLTEEERKSIENAPDKRARLERIRELRERQWIGQLPKTQQEQIGKAQGKERADLVRKLWQDDLERKADWLIAERHWDAMLHKPQQLPVSVATLPREMKDYFEKNIKPLLTADEEKRLKDAEGKWPRFPRVLIELADSHPLSVQGPIGPTRIKQKELAPLHKHLEKDERLRRSLEKVEGKWPEFGVVLRDDARKKEMEHVARLLADCTPARPKDFPTSVLQFIEKRLLPALTDEEQRALSKAEGNWPAYPRLVVELARRHNLPLPADPLPGPIDWDRYRIRSLSAAEGR
jgi:hypothetical protein